MSNGYQVTETAVKAQPKMTSCGSHWKAQTVTESGRTLAYIASWSVNCLYQLRLWFCLAHSIIFFQFKMVKSGYIIILLLYLKKYIYYYWLLLLLPPVAVWEIWQKTVCKTKGGSEFSTGHRQMCHNLILFSVIQCYTNATHWTPELRGNKPRFHQSSTSL